jgi:hypothetical protein
MASTLLDTADDVENHLVAAANCYHYHCRQRLRHLAESHVPHSLASRAVPNVDLNRGGHAGRKDGVWGHLSDMDADRDALGQAYPRKDRVDAATPWVAGFAFVTLIARMMLST